MTKILEDVLSSPAYAELSAARVEPDADVTDWVRKPSGKRALKGKMTPLRKRDAKAKAKQVKVTKVAEPKLKMPRVPKVKVAPFEPSNEHRLGLKAVCMLIRKNADNVFAIGGGLIALQQSIPERLGDGSSSLPV